MIKGSHHTERTREKLSKINRGKKLSKEHRQKMSKALKGKHYNVGRNNSRYGITHAKQTKRKISLSLKGIKNPNWKGGISSLDEKIRHLFEYRQWRSDIFTRDKFTCQRCGNNKGGNLTAHHIKSMSKILNEYKIKTMEEAIKCEELWNINNGITLCEKCHTNTSNYGNRKENDT